MPLVNENGNYIAMYSTIIKPSSIIAILWTKRQNRAIMVFLLIAILALPPSAVSYG